MRKSGKKLLVTLLALSMALGNNPSQSLAATTQKSTIKSISLDKTAYVLKKGEKLKLKATLNPSKVKNAKITWKSSNKKIVSVNGKGVAIAKAKKGKATITAKAGTKKASCEITVGTAVKKINAENISVNVGATKKIVATLTPAKASVKTLSYKSNNNKIAKVSKNGDVTGVSAGTTQIVVTAADCMKVKKVITVTVNANTDVGANTGNVTNAPNTKATNTPEPTQIPVAATAIALSTEEYLNIGSTLQLSATLTPAEASTSKITWKSENEKIATVSNTGLVTGVSAGDTTIVATIDNVTAKCVIHVGNLSVATSSEEISKALERDDLEYLVVQTSEKATFEIPKGTYTSTSLILNVPNGEVNNYGKFKSVLVKQIAPNTMHEYAVGNSIQLEAEKAHLVVEKEASASINVSAQAENTTIENNGTVEKMEIASEGKVVISGIGEVTIPVVIKAKINISSNQNLQIDAICTFSMTIRSGAEQTTVSVDTAEHKPEIMGLGMISVTIRDTGEVETIISKNPGVGLAPNTTMDPTGSDNMGLVNVKFTGKVLDKDEQPVTGASVILVPYEADYDYSKIKEDPQGIQLVTDENGKYSANTVETGNYIIAIEKEGYMAVQQTLVITSTYGSTYNNEVVYMLPSSFEGKTGGVSGSIKESLEGKALQDMTVRIRKNRNNLTGEVIKETTTDSQGVYTFEDLACGYYTVQVLDKRDVSNNERYFTVHFNVLVSPDVVTTGQGATMNIAILDEQIRFVLTWGDEESGAVSDADSHLVGPSADGFGKIHTYYSDKEAIYNEVMYANLDVDDVTYEGPETTTIYKETPGVYSFYIHDYSNGGSENSDQLGKSNVRVEVYTGSFLVATYYIPNEEGTLWHVCDYDSRTNEFITVNKMSYHMGDESDIGTSAKDIALRNVNNQLASLQTWKELFEEESATKLQEIIQSYREQIEALPEDVDADSVADLESEIRKINNQFKDDFSVSVSGNCVTNHNSINTTNWLTIELDYEEEKDYTIRFNEESCKVEEVTATAEDAVKAYKLTNKDGYVRIVQVFEKIDLSDIVPTEITFKENASYMYTISEDTIYVYGSSDEFTGIESGILRNGTEATVGTNDEGQITLTFKVNETISKTFIIEYAKKEIPKVNDPNNTIYQTVLTGSTQITIYGEAEKLSEDATFTMDSGYTCTIEDHDSYSNYEWYGIEVYDAEEDYVGYYSVYYYPVSKINTLSYVYDNAENDYEIDQTKNIVVCTNSYTSFSDLDSEYEIFASCGNSNETATIQYTENQPYVATITVSTRNLPQHKRVYKVYYRYNPQAYNYALNPDKVLVNGEEIEFETSRNSLYGNYIEICSEKDLDGEVTFSYDSATEYEMTQGVDEITGMPMITVSDGENEKSFVIVIKKVVIPEVVSSAGVIYGKNVDLSSKEITIYGDKECKETKCTFSVPEGYRCEIDDWYEEDAYTWYEVYVSSDDSSEYMYFEVKVYNVDSLTEIDEVTYYDSEEDDDISANIDYETNTISFSNEWKEEIEEFEVDLKYSVCKYNVEMVENEEYVATITVTIDNVDADDYSRVYQVCFEK